MQLAYLKMHGAGNLIVVVDQRETNLPPPSAEKIRLLGDDKTGPGFDQLMWVGPAKNSTTSASYRIFNADGSECEQCGNGVRCVFWMLARESGQKKSFALESPAGTIVAIVLDDGRIAVNMGPPEFDPRLVPFSAEAQADQYPLEISGTTINASVLSMGNPHCVVEVSDLESTDVATLGPAIECHKRFPAGTNVGFMQIRDRGTIDLREYERGVGETLACGTGACAAVVAGQRLGHLDNEVTVQMPGGQLVVSWRGEADGVWLTGEAELISEGTVDL
ncbi:MAG: diaminopimelate epimerase [Gammaproteobacteria bacterium]|nr:diaminopimelate epimerase [Gammaproteobacteria bacterium]